MILFDIFQVGQCVKEEDIVFVNSSIRSVVRHICVGVCVWRCHHSPCMHAYPSMIMYVPPRGARIVLARFWL